MSEHPISFSDACDKLRKFSGTSEGVRKAWLKRERAKEKESSMSSEAGEAVSIREKAKDIAGKLGGTVVGSATRSEKAHDIDILLTEEQIQSATKQLEAMGYKAEGSQIVSPSEAEKAGKDFGPGWARNWSFANEKGERVELWHEDKGMLVPIPSDSRADASIKKASTPEQDATYIKAAESGDHEVAQKMVDEAAKSAGYNIGPVWHGTSRVFNAFDLNQAGSNNDTGMWGTGFYFSPDKKMSLSYGKNMYQVYLSLQNPLVVRGNNSVLPKDLQPVSATHGTEGRAASDALRERLISNGYDGVVHYERSDKGLKMGQIIAFTPSQIKSADSIVRDDQGKIVPLSKRFDPKQKDIRFSAETKPIRPTLMEAFKAIREKFSGAEYLDQIGGDNAENEWLKKERTLVAPDTSAEKFADIPSTVPGEGWTPEKRHDAMVKAWDTRGRKQGEELGKMDEASQNTLKEVGGALKGTKAEKAAKILGAIGKEPGVTIVGDPAKPDKILIPTGDKGAAIVDKLKSGLTGGTEPSKQVSPVAEKPVQTKPSAIPSTQNSGRIDQLTAGLEKKLGSTAWNNKSHSDGYMDGEDNDKFAVMLKSQGFKRAKGGDKESVYVGPNDANGKHVVVSSTDEGDAFHIRIKETNENIESKVPSGAKLESETAATAQKTSDAGVLEKNVESRHSAVNDGGITKKILNSQEFVDSANKIKEVSQKNPTIVSDIIKKTREMYSKNNGVLSQKVLNEMVASADTVEARAFADDFVNEQHKFLSKFADSDGNITLYRGVTLPKNSFMDWNDKRGAVSYSLSREVAGSFADITGSEGRKDGFVIETKVPLKDAFAYMPLVTRGLPTDEKFRKQTQLFLDENEVLVTPSTQHQSASTVYGIDGKKVSDSDRKKYRLSDNVEVESNNLRDMIIAMTLMNASMKDRESEKPNTSDVFRALRNAFSESTVKRFADKKDEIKTWDEIATAHLNDSTCLRLVCVGCGATKLSNGNNAKTAVTGVCPVCAERVKQMDTRIATNEFNAKNNIAGKDRVMVTKDRPRSELKDTQAPDVKMHAERRIETVSNPSSDPNRQRPEMVKGGVVIDVEAGRYPNRIGFSDGIGIDELGDREPGNITDNVR